MPGRADIGGFDVTVVDAEIEDERDLGDEQESEEKGESTQRFLPTSLKGRVIDLIDASAERVERGCNNDAGEDRIQSKLRVDDVGDVRPENDKSGMGDIDDVKNPKR